MKKPLKIIVIVLVLLVELAWALWPRLSHGAVLDEPYRNAERKSALNAWVEHRTPETKAAFEVEVKLLDRHMETVGVTILAAGLALDAVGVYLFWKYVPTKM